MAARYNIAVVPALPRGHEEDAGDADMVYIPGPHCGTPFAPLSRRVDPEILSHGAAPRLTNAPVYKGYLSGRSSNGKTGRKAKERRLRGLGGRERGYLAVGGSGWRKRMEEEEETNLG